jgi:aspartate aminotransferase-like enzyme
MPDLPIPPLFDKPTLMIPGPTPVPPSVLQTLATPMIDHRGPQYEALQAELILNLKAVFQTQSEVMIFPAAGTGGLESAVVNTLSPGDRVLAVTVGAFGDRFGQIAQAYGAEVATLEFEWGQAANPNAVRQALKDKGPFKAVLVTFNETSTGVLNDIQTLAPVVKEHGALLLVDAISGLLAADLPMDRLGCDVVVAGSQKAFMIPPGLTFIAAGPAALEASRTAKMPRFYFDWGKMLKSHEKNQTPYTPALTLQYGLQVTLRAILEEGLENGFRRHERMAHATREAAKALNLKPLADPNHASPAVTAILAPEGVEVKALRNKLRNDFGVTVAGGQGKLTGKIFRIGHLGYITPPDLTVTFAALEKVLPELGHSVTAGAGVTALTDALTERDAVAA